MAITKRQQQALDTKNNILEKARELFASRSYDSVTMDEVAAHCGVAKGTIYYYFSSKEGLFMSISRLFYRRLDEELEEMEFSCFEDMLKYFILHWFTIIKTDSINYSRQWHHLAVDSKSINYYEGGQLHLDIDCEILVKCIRLGQSKNQLSPTTPVETLARDIAFSMYGASLYHLMKYSEQTFDVLGWAHEYVSELLVRFAPYRIS